MKKGNRIKISIKEKSTEPKTNEVESKKHSSQVSPLEEDEIVNTEVNENKKSVTIEEKLISFFSKKVKIIGLVLVALLFLLLFFFLSEKNTPPNEKATNKKEVKQQNYSQIPNGFSSKISVSTKKISLEDYLIQEKIPRGDASKISGQASGKFLEYLNIGDKVTAGYSKEEGDDIAEILIIEPKAEPNKYYYLQLTEPLNVKKESKAIEIITKTAVGIIDSSLWLTILDNNIHYQLIENIQAALAWSVDLFHLKPGDHFKVVYQERFIGGKSYGVERMDALYFHASGEDIYAFRFKDNGKVGYYDELGQLMVKAFLKSPLKYGRMSSPYSLDRKHPVTGENKPHFGTDYAAPTGTPILSVADGVVSIAAFKNNNGNYVKIKHNKTYESQYLHMSEFQPNVTAGTSVKQGQVIGYVGATGLATGPHVCFRFWKNGKQVDHRQEKLSSTKLISSDNMRNYTDYKDEMLEKLESIGWQ